MKEEFVVEFKADTSDLDKAESKIKDIASGSSATSKSTAATSANMGEVVGSLEAIKRLDAFSLLSQSLEKVADKIKDVKEQFKNFKVERELAYKLPKYFFKGGFKDPVFEEVLAESNMSKTVFAWKMGITLIKRQFQSLGAVVKSVGATIKAVLTSIQGILLSIVAVIASIVALVKMVNEISAIGAEFDDMTQKLQVSNEKFQQWSYIMKICGSDIESLQTAMNGMIQRLKSVEEGSETAIQGFQKLGISVYDASGNLRNQFELFEEAVDKLQHLTNATERQVIAQQIFGRSASNLTVLLNTSAEQMESIRRTEEALGLSLSDNVVAMSAQYQDALDTMKLAAQSFKGVISELILVPLTEVVKAITKAIVYIKIFIAGLFGIKDRSSSINKVGESVNTLEDDLYGANDAAKTLTRTLMGFDELNVLSPPSSSSTGLTGLEELEGFQLSDFKATFDALFSEEELGKIEKFRTTMETFGGRIKLIFSGLSKYILGKNTHNNQLVREGINEMIEGILGEDLPTLINGIKERISNWWNTSVPNWIKKITLFFEGIGKIIYGWISKDYLMVAEGIFDVKNAISDSGIDGEVNEIGENIIAETDRTTNHMRKSFIDAIDDILAKFGEWSRTNIKGYTFTGGYTYNTQIAMASGGIVSAPTRALVGEAGKEAVLPLENNTGWMDGLADRIASRNNTPSKIVLKVGEKELGWATINGINQIRKQTGQVQLVV